MSIEIQVTTNTENTGNFKSNVPDTFAMNIEGFEVQPHQSYGIMNSIIDKNIEFVDRTTVIFMSGCNLVCYDLEKKVGHFLIRKCPNYTITSMSIGFKTYTSDKVNDPYVCLGEYNEKTKISQISTISVRNPDIQYILSFNKVKDKNLNNITGTIKTKEDNMILDWKISFAYTLKNSPYCVGIAKKENQGMIHSKVSFWKYTQEHFISDFIIHENLNHCSYNPQNPLELILCGKGYLRLWNVFINEGSLKEHPQRYLRGKQEKEHNFIKAQFFENKSFMFIVGTTENLFFIIEGFQVIYDFNASYSIENIADMNIQNILRAKEEDEDLPEIGEEFMKSEESKDVDDEKNSPSVDIDSESEISNLSSTSKKEKEKEKTKINYENNPLRTFFLINNNLILMGFQQKAITYIYKLEKDFKNKKEREKHNLNKENDDKKSNIEDVKVLKLANNVKSIVNMMANSDKTQIIFMLEVYNNMNKKKTKVSKKKTISTNTDSLDTSICLYLFTRTGSKLIFANEIFKEYFHHESIKSLDVNEKKRIIFSLTDGNWLRCFDYNVDSFSIKHHLNINDIPTSVESCPNNNLFCISFTKKLIVYALFRDKIKLFCEFDVVNPYAKFTEKGDYLAIAGESQVNKNNYCIYIVDTFYFNTTYVIENIPKIKSIAFIDMDKYLFALLDNSVILGWNVRLDLMTINLMNRIREYDKSVEGYYFKLFFKHFPKAVEYEGFDYDSKNDLLLVTYKNSEKISVYNKLGRNLFCHLDTNKIPKIIKIRRDLKCVLVGTSEGSLQIYRWPFETSTEFKDVNINISGTNRENTYQDQLLYDINLHTKGLNNIYMTRNLKNIVTSSEDGSIIVSNLNIITSNNDELKEFDYFGNYGKKLRPPIEDIIKLCDVFEYKISDIIKKDEQVTYLDNNIKAMKQSMQDQKDSMLNDHKSEIMNLEIQKDEAISEEDKKEQQLRTELDKLKYNVENELQLRNLDHDKEKIRLSSKYDEKLQLYRNEIERLNLELKTLQESIEERFKNIINTQTDYFNSVFDNFNAQFKSMKEKIDESLTNLVHSAAENDEALDTTIKQYERMIEEMETKIQSTLEKNKSELKELKKGFDSEKVTENNFKSKLDEKVQESDKIIQKNAEIKKNIIDTTQRTITFQEQLLETEKNLQKIAKKLKDLDVKNKHLEQIRFVLEHRMTSLDKEKAPLEGQCLFLEKQKNNLQEEFNKLILQINLRNQFLENKQSQLRASLIQNFEINDQILYVKKKLKHLQNEIKMFIITYQNGDQVPQLSLQENKASYIALKLRQFYDKYFSNNIEHELQNYQLYLTKLQEESEKMNVANNFDLIMRDKGEEKLVSEKEKLEQIKVQKEKGFRRMQNENTILIAECNRLRKNLHEVYMHVVDIEQKFENLTKINPGLNKTEIVYQIKEFIRQTHNKIKSNFREGAEEDNNLNINNSISYQGNHPLIRDNINNNNFSLGNEIIRSVNDHNENIMSQNANLNVIRQKVKSAINSNTNLEIDNKSGYENFLLPEIKKYSMNNSHTNSTVLKQEITGNLLNLNYLPNIEENLK